MENAAGVASKEREEEMSKLNPCPQCGSEPDFKFLEADDHFGDEYVVGCKSCRDTILGRSKSANGAINAWNAATGEQPVKTLRDEFAMAALTGLLVNSGGPIQALNTCGWGLVNCSVDEVSSFVFSLADDMVRERNK